jgi:hypothetical protein
MATGYRRRMEEARAVLDRLERISSLDRAGAPPAELLVELRALVDEATAWSRLEGAGAAQLALDELGSALARAHPAGG